MLVNESSFDFALCVICYLSIVLDLSYVLLWDLLAFYSTLVLSFFLFSFASYFSFFVFHLWLLLGFRFFFLFFIFCFWLSSSSHFSFLSFTFRLWVKAQYNGPKLTDLVFIISHFHNVVYIKPNLPMTLNCMYHFSWKCNIAFPSTTRYILSFMKSL
jgi:hypothetical protein